jgi:glucose/arabinose dehydrogenase
VQHLLSPGEPLLVKTGAFQPFGKHTERVKGNVKANGAVLRMNRDGSGLEVYAWGLRNPFGLRWRDAKLYVTDLGFDERGSRPIANAPDVVWEVRQGGWYGWPDFAGGVPVTDARFRSKRGGAPEFLLEKHPAVEKPFFTRPPHASPTKFDFSTSARFGFEGQMFLGEFGGGAPVTGPAESLVESQVVRVDLATKAVVPFFRTRKDALGPAGYEYAVTAGPKRPVDVRFSPDGASLYVIDFGAMAGFAAGAGPAVRPFPGTGVLWRITRNGVDAGGPPPGRSTLAGRAAK